MQGCNSEIANLNSENYIQNQEQTNIKSLDAIKLIENLVPRWLNENLPGYPLDANGVYIAVTAVNSVSRSLRKQMLF